MTGALVSGTDRPVTCLRENLVYANPYIRMYADAVRFHDEGRDGIYVRADRPGPGQGVVVLPVCSGEIALVCVYRYPTGRWEWGLPRGYAKGGDPEVTVRAELREELGADPSEITSLGEMTPDSGLLSTVVLMFIATYDVKSWEPEDAGEVSAVAWVPVPELLAYVANGTITDGFTLAALCRAQSAGLLGRVVTMPPEPR